MRLGVRSRRGEARILRADTDRVSMLERLASRSVRVDSGCIVWRGCVAGRGYGVIGSANCQVYAHRAAWLVHRGPIPESMCVLHRCDNPPCINPDHLWLGAHKDNSRDAAAKGRLGNNKTHGEDRPQAKLTGDDVSAIREAYHSGARVIDIHRQFPRVTYQNIAAIAKCRTWRHL